MFYLNCDLMASSRARLTVLPPRWVITIMFGNQSVERKKQARGQRKERVETRLLFCRHRMSSPSPPPLLVLLQLCRITGKWFDIGTTCVPNKHNSRSCLSIRDCFAEFYTKPCGCGNFIAGLIDASKVTHEECVYAEDREA